MTHDNSGFDPPSLGELITLRETVELSGLSASHLCLLVSRGELWGVKLGRNWEDSGGGRLALDASSALRAVLVAAVTLQARPTKSRQFLDQPYF